MGKRLSQMTWEEVQREMSIAGNPEKIAQLGVQLEKLISQSADNTNRAEMINIEFMLKRLSAEVRQWQLWYDETHSPGHTHPESVCQQCSGSNVVWSATNDLWNEIIGSPNGIICPQCFEEIAIEKGISVIFRCE